MLFATWLSVLFFFASLVVAIWLASESAWAIQHPWVLVFAKWGTSISGMCAIATTQWFRRLVQRIFIGSPQQQSTVHPVGQKTSGSNSPTFANTGAGTLNVNMPISHEREPTMRHRATQAIWSGVIDATCKSRLLVGETGRVRVFLSSEAHAQTQYMAAQRADLSAEGRLESKTCSVPFRKVEDQIDPAAIRLELVSASDSLYCPKRLIDMDLNWYDTQKEASFQIQTSNPGDHAIDVLLLVRKKQVAQVSLVTMVDPKKTAEDDYERVAEVRIIIHVGRYISKERTVSKEEGPSQSIDRDRSKKRDRSLGEEYDQGISM